MTVAASYERVSQTIQALGYSLDTQRLTSDQFAAQRDWQLPDELRFRDGEDEDASGADSDLPDLMRMLAVAKTRVFSVLLVPVHDRLARNMGKALAVESQLEAYGVRVIYLNAPDDGSPEGKLLRHNLHAFAEYDREKRKILTTLNRRYKATMGRWVGAGTEPYGYRAVRDVERSRIIGLEINPEEAEVVREIYKRALHDSGAMTLRWLDKSGIPAPRQTRGSKGAAAGWSHSTLHDILTSGRYKGCADYAGIEIPVPAIVDADLWQRVQDARAARRNRPTGWTKRQADGGDPYLLRGRLVCGHCGRPGSEQVLRTQRLAAYDRRYYTCPNKFESRINHIRPLDEHCPLPSVRAELIESMTWALLCEALGNAELLEEGLRDAQARREQELARRGDRLDAIEREFAKAMRTLERTTRRLNELDEDDIEVPALERQRADMRKILDSLKAQREGFMLSVAPVGLSPEQIVEVKALFRELALVDATDDQRRRVIQLLDIRATVYADDGQGEDAVQVQYKPKRYVRLEWADTVIRLQSDRRFLKLRLLCSPSRFEVIGVVEAEGTAA